jgi:hypothetical protein
MDLGQHLISGSYHSADSQCGTGSRARCRGDGAPHIESDCTDEVEAVRPDHTDGDHQRQDRRHGEIDLCRRSADPIANREHDKDNQIEQLIEAGADIREDDR